MTRTFPIAILSVTLAACVPSNQAYDAFLAGAIPSGSAQELARACFVSGATMAVISQQPPSAAERLALGFEGFEPAQVARYNTLGQVVGNAGFKASPFDLKTKASQAWFEQTVVAEGWRDNPDNAGSTLPTRRGAWQRLERRVNWCAKHFNVDVGAGSSGKVVAGQPDAPSGADVASASGGAGAGQAGAASSSQAADDPATLNTDGLNLASDLQAIYAGRFDQVRFKHAGLVADAVVEAYLNAFNDRCQAYMPADKVEITEDQCTREEWEEDEFGNEVSGSRSCVSHRTVATGRYEDPELRSLVDNLQISSFGETAGLLYSNPIAGLLTLATSGLSVTAAADADMPRLLSLNGCGSDATKRFQENLERFARGENP